MVDGRRIVDQVAVTTRKISLSLLPALLACAALAAPAIASAGTPCADADLMPAGASDDALREATLCLVNAERTSRGLKALLSNAHLRRAAQNYSRRMVRQRFFDHVCPSGSTLTSRVRGSTAYLRGARRFSLGENIAWGSGYLATPRQTVVAWMQTPGHRANILRGRFRHVGVGVAIGAPEDGEESSAATYTTAFGYRALR